MAFDTSQALSIQAARTIDVGRGDGGLTGGWLVHGGLSYLAPLPLESVYPKPDAETPNFVYNRKAHPDREMIIPIGVRAGGWPYKYEIIDGPVGASIGSELNRRLDIPTGKTVHELHDDYGVIRWTPQTSTGTVNWEIRVTDQMGDSVTLTWSTEIDESAFVFVDSVNGDDANPGGINSKLQTFANGLWKNDDNNATFAGKIAIFEGTFDINSGTIPSSPILDPSKKPCAFISDTGAVFNMSNGHFRTGNPEDFVLLGITTTGSRSDLANNRLFNFTDVAHRVMVFDCEFDDYTIGTVGDDNPAVFFFAGGGAQRHSNLFFSCNRLGANAGSQLFVTFDSEVVLGERNTASDSLMPGSNGRHFIHIKDDTDNVTVRANNGSCETYNGVISISNQNTLIPDIKNQEVCYNTVIMLDEGGDSVRSAIFWNSQNDGTNMHDYRNTVIAPARAFRFGASVEDVSAFNSVYVGDVFGVSVVPQDGSQPVSLQSSDFDSEFKLTGTARDTHLGVSGAEMADSGGTT